MTSAFGDTLLQAIREQIARNTPRTMDQGTVQSVRSDSYRAMVVMDGSSVAMPVKTVGNVDAGVGDRVILSRYGSDWVIVGAYHTGGLGYGYKNESAASGNTSSGSFTAVPSATAFSISKRWDWTVLRLDLATSCFSSTASSRVEVGIQIAGVPYPLAKQFFATSVTRSAVVGFDTVGFIPAGDYTASVVWRLDAGVGPIQQQIADDWVSASVTEIPNG